MKLEGILSKLVHILNLNEDPMLSEKIKINLEKKTVIVTRTFLKNEPNTVHQIVLKGVNIFDNHALICY